MPRNKDLKRLVRASAPVETATPDYAALAGYSDATMKAKTGCTWDKWVFVLDRHGASSMKHGEITRLVRTKYPKVPAWWTQTVAVGYERIKGRRAFGQRLDGTYEASKSRTFAVPVDVLFDAWIDARLRKRWLPENVRVRTATRPKSIRLGFPDGSIVAVGFTAKAANRSTVGVQHPRLPDRKTADATKALWSERLDALASVLKSTSPPRRAVASR